MEIEKIKEHILLLRERRENLAELRDYRTQKRAAKGAEPVLDSKPAEEIFAGLFTTVEEAADDNNTENRGSAEPSTYGSDNGQG